MIVDKMAVKEFQRDKGSKRRGVKNDLKGAMRSRYLSTTSVLTLDRIWRKKNHSYSAGQI